MPSVENNSNALGVAGNHALIDKIDKELMKQYSKVKEVIRRSDQLNGN